jgi:hypothetical protein
MGRQLSGDSPFRMARVPRATLNSVQLDAVALRALQVMLAYPKEVAFRLLCLPNPHDTVLRVTGEAGSTRVGEGMDVAPAEPDGRPCIFSHTHVRVRDRRYSPPSLNDIVSLINDCRLGITSIPIAAVAAAEPDGARLYLYDCISAPRAPAAPVSPEDIECMVEAARRLRGRTHDGECRSAAVRAVLGALHAAGGRPFNLLRSTALDCPPHAPHSWRSRWIEYAASAALAMDSRCGFEFPDWLADCVEPSANAARDAALNLQFTELEAGRRCFRELRGWHIAVRDVEVPDDSDGTDALPSTLVVRL